MSILMEIWCQPKESSAKPLMSPYSSPASPWCKSQTRHSWKNGYKFLIMVSLQQDSLEVLTELILAVTIGRKCQYLQNHFFLSKVSMEVLRTQISSKWHPHKRRHMFLDYFAWSFGTQIPSTYRGQTFKVLWEDKDLPSLTVSRHSEYFGGTLVLNAKCWRRGPICRDA